MDNQINAELNLGPDDLLHCGGIRVFYYDRTRHMTPCSVECFISDHDHTSEWNKQLQKGGIFGTKDPHRFLEAGTVVCCWRKQDNDTCLDVLWDCGTKKIYSQEQREWENICVLDMGPAGYRAPIVLCDVCLTPVTGFSFRCTDASCSKGLEEVFDLCYKHYNLGCHFESGHQFQRIMQTKFTFEPKRNVLPSRSEGTKFHLIGLFSGAAVIKIPNRTMKGKLVKVVHQDGNKEFSRASAWNCTAEVNYDGCKELSYEDIGTEGKIGISALEPGDGGPVYADHFPTIGYEILKGISQFYLEVKMLRLRSGHYCYISQDPPSITISNTALSGMDSEPEFSKELEGLHSGLEVLNLLHNQLKDLPFSLQRFRRSLRIAALSFNTFDTIPFQFRSCVALENLNLIHNQITIVPNYINELSNLKDLFLDSNSIRVLPDELCELHSLRVLGLSCNLLVSLPASFSKLNNLHRLDLHHNHFKVFPSVLCSPELLKIKSLSLDNNRIQVIPESAKYLISNLSTFTIFNNPLQINNALELSNTDLIDAIKSSFSLTRPRGHIRVTVLGKSGSGKSSLVKALVDKDRYVTPADKEVYDHTVGIDQYSYRFSFEGGVYEVALWDFAGEKSYAMMNQMFLSQRTLVWFVFDMNKYETDGNDKKCFQQYIGKWLRSVIACIGTPTVWFIGTHADKCSSPERVIESVTQNVIKELEYIEKTCPRHSQCCFFVRQGHADAGKYMPNISYICNTMEVRAVSNTHDLSGHQDLKDCMEKNLPKLFSDSFKELKTTWSSAQEYLSEIASKELKCLDDSIIEKKELHMLLKEKGLIENEEDFEKLLKYLHQTGDVLYFRKTESSCIFLDPVWLIILLKEIFREDIIKHINKNRHIYNAPDVKPTATITKKALKDDLWKDKGVTNTSFTKIVDCLFDFGLAFNASGLYNDESLLFPWFLSEDKITFSNVAQHLGHAQHLITLVYMFPFIPPTFFERLLTYCTKGIKVCGIKKSYILGELEDHEQIENHIDICVFSMLDYEEDCDNSSVTNDDRDLHKGYVVFVVSNKNPNADKSYRSMWSSLAHLTRSLRTLLKSWWHCACLDIKVACPECVRNGVKNPHFIDVKVLEEEPRTYTGHCQHKILADKLFPPSRAFKDIVITSDDLLDLQENVVPEHLSTTTEEACTCSTRFLNLIASKVSVQIRWKSLAKRLQLSEDDIAMIETNYQADSLYERCYQMLRMWSQQAGCSATVLRLNTAVFDTCTYDTW